MYSPRDLILVTVPTIICLVFFVLPLGYFEFVVRKVEADAALHKAFVEEDKLNIEKARFMLECTHDWMHSAEDCRAILDGKDPSPDAFSGC